MVKQPPKGDAHKSSASLASKQIKVKASMPHEAKMPKENEEKTSVCIDELSLHSQYKLSIIVDLTKNHHTWLLLALRDVEDDKARIQVTASKDEGKKAAKEANSKSSEDSNVKSTKSDEASRGNHKSNHESNDEDDGIISYAKERRAIDKSSFVLAKLSDIDNMRSKAKKVMIENAFINLCVAMRHIEVTSFVEMDEEFFHLCKDTKDDAKNINFEVGATWACEGKPNEGKFDMAKSGMVSNWDEQIDK
ncbi:hypothetical protein SLEP1_g42502 [Rubroshorea leprosula]|uniref:Uncharacterized protein n=1 Tax=Rubroshorea leprosula TaxID=152421 RepID=A0AAV5LA07_9ROSI|nr:hypothetical protein SLEP1_g42502 [Rubroshorea leprosula]